MNAIRIFLLALIIIGIGLLQTQKMWVPTLVNEILKKENMTLPTKIEKNDCVLSQFGNSGSEHVIIQEVFWSPKLDACLAVKYRALWGGSDWANQYTEEKGFDASEVIEGVSYSLANVSDEHQEEILSQTYQYKDLDDYLHNRNRWSGWKRDFLARVEKYRSK